MKEKRKNESDEVRIKYLRKCIKDKLVQHKDVKNLFLLWQKN